jgi:hypothetical protein
LHAESCLLSDSLISHRKHPSSQGLPSIKHRWELLGEVLSDGMDVAIGDDVARQEFKSLPEGSLE